EQSDFLIDHRQRPRQNVSWHLIAWNAIEQNISGPWAIQTAKNLCDSRFPATGFSDQSDTRSGGNAKVEIVKQRFVSVITKCHITKLDISIERESRRNIR